MYPNLLLVDDEEVVERGTNYQKNQSVSSEKKEKKLKIKMKKNKIK